MDTIRKVSIALGIRCRGQGKSVGFISLQPSASRSALALAYAEREANAGRKVLLVDADASAAALTSALAPDGERRGCGLDAGAGSLEEVLVRLESGVEFLPVSAHGPPGETASLPKIGHLADWRSQYDLVVIDFPPAGPVSEARLLQPAVDAFVCTVQWGRTPRQHLRALLRSDLGLRSQICGVVVTDVVKEKLLRYDPEADVQLEPEAA